MMSRFKRAFQRFLVSIPRTFTPVLTLRDKVLVFRNADVLEVLERQADFSQTAGEAIERYVGPFVLGMADGPEYRRAIGILHSVVKRQDTERIRKFVREASRKAAASFGDRFDVVDGFTREVPYQLTADYFGVAGPDRDTFLSWNRYLFWDIFMNLDDDKAVRRRAEKEAGEMNAWLDELIAQRKGTLDTGGQLPDDLLSRMLALQGQDVPSFDDAEVRCNIAGLYLGWSENVNKVLVNVLQVLFSRPKVLKAAREAAARDDVETVGKIGFEALRFHPQAPVLMRLAKETQTVGGNGRKRRTIRGGKAVWAMTQSAMFDPRAVTRPNRFDTERPRSLYLYFGHGLHECFGNYANYVAIPELLTALMKIDGMRPAGKLRTVGPFPDHWEMLRG